MSGADSSNTYSGRPTHYESNYDDEHDNYVKPRVNRPFRQTKVSRGPHKSKSPVKSQEYIFHGKKSEYVTGPKDYNRNRR